MRDNRIHILFQSFPSKSGVALAKKIIEPDESEIFFRIHFEILEQTPTNESSTFHCIISIDIQFGIKIEFLWSENEEVKNCQSVFLIWWWWKNESANLAADDDNITSSYMYTLFVIAHQSIMHMCTFNSDLTCVKMKRGVQ